MHTKSRGARRVSFALLTIGASGLSLHEAAAQLLGDEWHGSNGGQFGAVLANAGDVDGDGVDDLLVGEPYYSPSGGNYYEGRVSLFSGATHALIRAHDGTQANEFFGTAIAGAGDVDQDGHADYVLGSFQHASNGFANNGEVTVFSGVDGSVIWSLDGTATNEYLGYAVAGIDDVDGDGKPDVLASPYSKDVVTAYDASGGVIYSVTGTPSTLFGYSLAACGDLDGDGTRDFVVGAPYESSVSPAVNFCGAVHAFSAKTGTPLATSFGDNLNDNLGRVVSSLGDVNGDGIPDLLASSYTSFGNGSLSGMVRVASGADGTTIRTTYGDTVNDRLGSSLVGMADLDGDGVDDYAVGTIDGPAPYFVGRVRVCSGSSGVVIFEWQGWTTNDAGCHDFGSGLATGDFNLDGAADLVIGDQSYASMDPQTGIWSSPGGAFLYYGCAAAATNYGAGWPGKNGIPGLVALDKPVPGLPISIQIDNSLGASTTGVMFLGLSAANIPTNKGGTLLVSPLLTFVLPIPAGGLTLGDTLPNDPALYGLDVFLQVIELDSYASKGLSFTPGLRLHCGYDLP